MHYETSRTIQFHTLYDLLCTKIHSSTLLLFYGTTLTQSLKKAEQFISLKASCVTHPKYPSTIMSVIDLQIYITVGSEITAAPLYNIFILIMFCLSPHVGLHAYSKRRVPPIIFLGVENLLFNEQYWNKICHHSILI